MADAEATYESIDSILKRCRLKRMLSVRRRARMAVLEFNEVPGQGEKSDEEMDEYLFRYHMRRIKNAMLCASILAGVRKIGGMK